MRLWLAVPLVAGLFAAPTTTPPAAAAWSGTPHGRQTPVTVAVIDTGIAPIGSFGGSIRWRGSRSFVRGEGLVDADGHGTAMASIIHAGAPAAHILAIKALDHSGDGSDPVIARAVRYAASAGAQVINLSMSGAQPLPKVRRALSAAGRLGVLVVVAAGNEGLDIGAFPAFPASYRLGNVAVVAAADERGRILPGSNYGRPVAVRAQGQSVPACDSPGLPILENGTSAAAALVSAQAARLLVTSPHRSPSRVRSSLTFAAARPQPVSCSDRDQTAGSGKDQ